MKVKDDRAQNKNKKMLSGAKFLMHINDCGKIRLKKRKSWTFSNIIKFGKTYKKEVQRFFSGISSTDQTNEDTESIKKLQEKEMQLQTKYRRCLPAN